MYNVVYCDCDYCELCAIFDSYDDALSYANSCSDLDNFLVFDDNELRSLKLVNEVNNACY